MWLLVGSPQRGSGNAAVERTAGVGTLGEPDLFGRRANVSDHT